jgi:cytochrome c oxidase cbb3-type subunit 2
MSRSGTYFIGLFGCFALSFGVAVLAPHLQLGPLSPSFKEEDGQISEIYPVASTSVNAGREVYVSQGCQACHSQVVQGPEAADIERGWGVRRTVARDYLFEAQPVVGASRLGPDLTNVGSSAWRNEPEADVHKPAKRDAAWQLLHLYHPTAVIRTSVMPAYPHLFEKRKVTGEPSPLALNLPSDLQPGPGYEIVPTAAGKALVAYLGSLDRSHPLKEAGAIAKAPAAKK